MDKTHNQQKPDSSVADAYWKANISLLLKLMTVWFIVSFGCGILFVEQLNAISFMGMPLGFWFAQQGAIYTFVALIFVYVIRMNKIERDFGVND
ncbi:MAG: DUF4212 domain-containing protein [Pseudomonadota bacterium]